MNRVMGCLPLTLSCPSVGAAAQLGAFHGIDALQRESGGMILRKELHHHQELIG